MEGAAQPAAAVAGPTGRLILAGAGLIIIVVIGLLVGAPAILLVGCVVAGFGITYLSGIALNLEERIAFGTVLGTMAVSIATFALSMIVRDVTLGTVIAGLAVAVGAGAGAAFAHRDLVAQDISDAAARWAAPVRSAGHPWPVAAVFLVCGAWTVHFLQQAYVYKPAGLWAGYVNIWGDWAAHLTFAGSFAYGHNFPPQYPIDPGNNLGYPFMIDFLAANLVPLGSSLTSALVVTSGLLGLAFPAVFYLAAARFTGSRAAAAIAVFVFLLSGGLGFYYLVGDILHSGIGVLAHLPREYTLNRDLNFQWLNPVLAYLVPQRSTVFGFSLALIVLVLVWLAVRERGDWRAFLFAGAVAGLMPAFHVHAYGTVVALSVFWAIFNWRREWLAFYIPALLLAVPVLIWMWPPFNNSYCGQGASIPVGMLTASGIKATSSYCVEVGWLSYTDWQRDGVLSFPVDWVWFWIKNTSLFIPLLVAAHFAQRWFPTRFGKWFAPMWLWFVVPNIVVLQPWDWDNTKFFIFWALLGSIMVGGLIAGIIKSWPGRAVVAAALLVVLGLSGAADLVRASDPTVSSYQFTDTKGLQVAAWVRQNTPTDAVFALADEHNSPIPTLAGRRVMSGFQGWLWTYGLRDYQQKSIDEVAILRGAQNTPDLVDRYGVTYVLIGPQELAQPRSANQDYWRLHGTLVYSNGEYSVYKV
ncbi:MAG TPA: hypothetical protein VEL12_11450 [Candidatus Nitrosopolaris sp.]|nr:hypothetical protein [Candidatus Nitrosopolaris sp.]